MLKTLLHKVSSREDNKLPALDAVLKITRVKNKFYLGVKQIEVEKIIGSEGRYADFEKNFLPINDNIKYRLNEISRLYDEGFHFPPISVFKIDDYYFVRDGNHRVAVAKSRGQIYIDAEITEYLLDVPITPQLTTKERILIQEHSSFLKTTGLDELGRNAVINLSKPESYSALLKIIKTFITTESQHQQTEISLTTGARVWYHRVFLPFAEDAYRFDLLHRFPKRTTGDLYVWLQSNWHKLRYGSKNERLSYMAIDDDKEDAKSTISNREVKLISDIYNAQTSKLEDNFLLSHNIAIAVLNVMIYISNPLNPKLVIVKRKYHPSEGQWSIPISMLRFDEEIKEASIRCQQHVLGLKNHCQMQQFCIVDSKNRHPFGRSIGIGMLGLVFDFKQQIEFTAGHLADSIQTSELLNIPNLVFDHYKVYVQALKFIAENANHTSKFKQCVLDRDIPYLKLQDSLDTIAHIYRQNFATSF